MVTRFLPIEAGVSAAGDGVPTTGWLRNLEGQQTQRRAARISWVHDPEAETVARVYAYIDGRLANEATAADHSIAMSFLASGDSSLQLLLAGESEAPPQTLVDPFGRNAMLFWSRSPSWDCIGYNVYNAADSILVEEIRDIEIAARVKQAPDAGTGTGRISAWGSVPPGTVENGTLVIDVTGPGAATSSFSGAPPAAFDFVQGGIVSLVHGVQLAFHDSEDSYQSGDSWEIQIGPRANFTSDTLAPGEHVFSIAAVDTSGNISVPQVAPAVYVMAIPDPVVSQSSSYDSLGGSIQVNFVQPAGALGVRVYCNFNPHTGLFEDYVVTDGLPFADIAAPGGSWAFDPGTAQGQLLFYLRPYNSECERDDSILYRFNFPPEPVDLGIALNDPANLEATAGPGGTWILAWDYQRPASDGAAEFLIYKTIAGTEIDYDTDLVATVSADSYTRPRPVRHFIYNHPVPDVGAVRLTVRASDGAGHTTTNTAYAEVTLDSTPPIFEGPVHGGPA